MVLFIGKYKSLHNEKKSIREDKFNLPKSAVHNFSLSGIWNL